MSEELISNFSGQSQLQKFLKHPKFGKITFREKDHKYFINENGFIRTDYISVTTIVSMCFPAFDKKKVAMKVLRSSKNPTYVSLIWKKHGVQLPLGAARSRKKESSIVQSVLNTITTLWEHEGNEAMRLGTKMHYYCENFLKTGNKDLPVDKEIAFETQQFKHFMNESQKQGLKPYASELMIYHQGICGTVDALFVHEDTGEIHLKDWKRCKKLNKYGFERGLYCFDHLTNANLHKYTLQLNIYATILKEGYGINVASMSLVVFHPNQKSYQEVFVEERQRESYEMFAMRNHLYRNQSSGLLLIIFTLIACTLHTLKL